MQQPTGHTVTNAPSARSAERARRFRRQRGQAAVEAALTMPLAVFVILGTLQLFMMLHGRIMAEYAVYRATRAGSLNQADCRVMTHVAVAALLPAIGARTDDGARLATAFRFRSGNRYSVVFDRSSTGMPRTGPIVWIVKRLDRTVTNHNANFDDRFHAGSRAELEVDMVFWYPLRIPFADWVMSRMFLAYYGLMPYVANNPLMPAERNAMWTREGSSLTGAMGNHMRTRALIGDYLAPIRTSYRMRMMTPAMLNGQACPNSPTNIN